MPFVLAGDRVVPFVQGRLPPVPHVPAGQVARLIADLGSERFAVRHGATVTLETFVDSAEPALRRALAAPASLEMRRRIEQVLEKLELTRWPRRLRAVRAVELLQEIGSRSARVVLAGLADGAPGARVTREAQAAWDRLAKRSVVAP